MNTASEFALITGASSGIGVDFARELASRGYSLILSARRTERLDEVQREIEKEHHVAVHCLPADLGSSTGVRGLYNEIERAGWEVSVLVNNAGLGHFGDFFDSDYETIRETLAVNLHAATEMAWLVGRKMKQARRGFILNVSSYSAFQPPTDLAVYAASKSYLYSLSQAINVGLRPHNVSATALCPGFFQSEFFDKSGLEPSRLTRMFMLTSQQVARAGIKGMFKRRPLVVPGLAYQFSLLMMRFLPRSMATSTANYVMRN